METAASPPLHFDWRIPVERPMVTLHRPGIMKRWHDLWKKNYCNRPHAIIEHSISALEFLRRNLSYSEVMSKFRGDDYHPTQRVEDVSEILESSCYCHSRQAEATIYQALWPLPKRIVSWAKHNVEIRWKRKNDVAVLHQNGAQMPYLIILDTKLENESMAVRKAILVLKIAEAHLTAKPVRNRTREQLATHWGADLAVLDSEAIQGLHY